MSALARPWRAAMTATAVLALCTAGASACGGGVQGDWSWFGGGRRQVGGGEVRVRWVQRLTPEYEGAYLPVERAVPTLDPSHDRIYVGSTAGHLNAMTATGGHIYRYEAGGAIESAPALDAAADELYVGTEQGTVHALRASDGHLRWRDRAGGPVRQAPALTRDAVYVVTDSDQLVAFARDDGTILWSYQRDAPEGFSITSHAGIALASGKVLAGFTDGVAVALDAASGDVVWEHDTSVDVDTEDEARPRFVDVDTTPVVIGNTVWIASFSAGLYALDLATGTVLDRNSGLAGVVGLARAPTGLVLVSADEGIVYLDVSVPGHRVIWRQPVERGSPAPPVVVRDHVLVGEAGGAFRALSLDDGTERSRFEAGYGFSAPAAVDGGLGFVVSNGGTLFAFAY